MTIMKNTTSTIKSRSVQYWTELKKARELARAKKLASGKLVIGLDKHGKPITIPKRKE